MPSKMVTVCPRKVLLVPGDSAPPETSRGPRGSQRDIVQDLGRLYRLRRRLRAFGLSIVVLVGFASLGAAASATPPRKLITIGIVGDQTLSSDLDRSYTVLAQGVKVLAGRHPDVVLHTGDLVESTGSPEEIRSELQRAAVILDRLPVRWHLTAGDHDVSPPDWQAGSSDRSREALFQELYGAREPAFRAHPWYSFDVRGFHFVALYSQQTLRVDPRWGDIFLARIHDDQLAWLRQDLEAHRRARAVVVFLHQPLWYHWSGWKRVHDLLRRYPVAAVVAGHFHYDQDEGEIDGIRYLIVGATGGDTKHGSRDAGDAQHVTLLRISGSRRVRVELLPVAGGGPLPITPREDMDRVQALDVELGNLWDFANRNPVFLKEGRLVADCANGQPARIRIDAIGNPIDLPMTLEIGFHSEPAGIALDGPSFGRGLCQKGEDPGACLLPPATRTVVANYSSVDIQSGCPVPKETDCVPVWETGLIAAGGSPLAAGTTLSFNVRTTFSGASGKLFLERTVTTAVKVCP
jgi:predicted phosphohydrolase